jgi:hypothetical protein
MRLLSYLPTHSCLSSLVFPYPGTSILHRTKWLPSLWCHIQQSSATYLAGAMCSPCVLFGWWFSLWELWGFWLVDIVVLPMRLQTPSAPTVLALTSQLGSPHSVQLLAVFIRICIGLVLAEPLRGQLYQAPVSKYFLVSTIVSGFGVCMWSGSPRGGAVSGWPFFSLYSTLCPCPLDRRNSGLKFWRWVGGPPSMRGACLTSGYGLDRFPSLL